MRQLRTEACLLQSDHYEEYPKLKELVMRKDELVAMRATPPIISR